MADRIILHVVPWDMFVGSTMLPGYESVWVPGPFEFTEGVLSGPVNDPEIERRDIKLQEVSGAVVDSSYVKSTFGEEAYEKLIAHLKAHGREIYEKANYISY